MALELLLLSAMDWAVRFRPRILGVTLLPLQKGGFDRSFEFGPNFGSKRNVDVLEFEVRPTIGESSKLDENME